MCLFKLRRSFLFVNEQSNLAIIDSQCPLYLTSKNKRLGSSFCKITKRDIKTLDFELL